MRDDPAMEHGGQRRPGMGARAATTVAPWVVRPGQRFWIKRWRDSAVARGVAERWAVEALWFDPALILPLALGTGVLLYFAAPEEPGLAGPAAVFAAAVLTGWVTRRRWGLYLLAFIVAGVAAGFGAAALRTRAVAAPALTRSLVAQVSGVVLETEARVGGGQRILLRPVRMDGVSADHLPHYLRLTVRRGPTLQAGDAVVAKALMQPPSPPSLPGGYDFARDAFFDGIGGVGFVAGTVRLAEPIPLTHPERWHAALDRTRNALTARIAAAIPGVDGAVAASQVTGKRTLIPEEANAALRSAGLYHVVSISGLHMTLFAGGLFWLIRAVLALVPSLALRRPIKQAAAVLALLPAAAYTAFSGAEVATVRSFLMTAIALLAVALGRSAVTRRNVALSASLVLVTTPEELLGPSFQMSFAAVAMLVAWADRPWRPGSAAWFHGLHRPLQVVLGLMAVTVVASLATAPFSTFHFHRITLQAIASNLVATPLVEMAIMPLALLALLAEPFGYGPPLWWAMGQAVHLFMTVARIVAAWPGADIVTPQFSAATLLAFASTLVVLVLARTALALIAFVPLTLGLLGLAVTEQPTVLIGAGGRAALTRSGEDVTVLAERRDAFTIGQWLLASGDRRLPADQSLTTLRRCDPQGCAAPLGAGRWLMVDRTADAVEEDCGRVVILVTPLAVPGSCPGTLVVHGTLARAAGSLAIYEVPGAATGWRVVPARQPGLSRPWAQRAADVPMQPALSSADDEIDSPSTPDN